MSVPMWSLGSQQTLLMPATHPPHTQYVMLCYLRQTDPLKLMSNGRKESLTGNCIRGKSRKKPTFPLFTSLEFSPVWWCMLLILAHRRWQRQEHLCEFEASFVYSWLQDSQGCIEIQSQIAQNLKDTIQWVGHYFELNGSPKESLDSTVKLKHS